MPAHAKHNPPKKQRLSAACETLIVITLWHQFFERVDPVIAWNLAAASTALFGLILAVNVLGDAVRDVLDPRATRV